ncbi:MAG: putative oxidoreductase [Aeromicrobium sp.]|nr:putative oxidoreductase [Aeromicrobium sp.]
MISPDDIRLDGRVGLVTGGASGIGQGIALGLAAFGADVAIVDIDAEGGASTVEQIQALGRRALFVQADLMDADQTTASVATATAELGLVDVLVNNVGGGGRPRPFLEQSPRSRGRVVDLNLGSLFAATHAVAHGLVDAGRGGSIINIASIEALRAAPGFAVYAATKAGMAGFSRTLALELAEHDIRVNVIAPDIVLTDGLAAQMPDERVVNRYIPQGRVGTLDDCAAAAVFLASDMSGYMTGNVLNVDGGTYASSGWTRTRDNGWTLFPQDVD